MQVIFFFLFEMNCRQIILAIVMREFDERRAESDPDPLVVAASGLRYVDSFVLVGSWTSSRSCDGGCSCSEDG